MNPSCFSSRHEPLVQDYWAEHLNRMTKAVHPGIFHFQVTDQSIRVEIRASTDVEDGAAESLRLARRVLGDAFVLDMDHPGQSPVICFRLLDPSSDPRQDVQDALGITEHLRAEAEKWNQHLPSKFRPEVVASFEFMDGTGLIGTRADFASYAARRFFVFKDDSFEYWPLENMAQSQMERLRRTELIPAHLVGEGGSPEKWHRDPRF